MLANQFDAIIQFHSTDCALPQVIGAIDGTHIVILSTGGGSKVNYYCRDNSMTSWLVKPFPYHLNLTQKQKKGFLSSKNLVS